MKTLLNTTNKMQSIRFVVYSILHVIILYVLVCSVSDENVRAESLFHQVYYKDGVCKQIDAAIREICSVDVPPKFDTENDNILVPLGHRLYENELLNVDNIQ
uniref:Uncharacterized protein n=1 Tax=Trichobilharzia regenti TaxID=157069 RepID=A0AA85J9E5_TRIRE|nr:unnamed protein product [Trichobilharzia regenti]